MKTQAKNNVVILGRAVNLFPETGQVEKIDIVAKYFSPVTKISLALAIAMLAVLSPSKNIFADGGYLDTSDYQKRALNEMTRLDEEIASIDTKIRLLKAQCREMYDILQKMRESDDNSYYVAKDLYAEKCE